VTDARDVGRLVPFVDCSPDELERVRTLSRRIAAAAGERLIVAGEPGRALLVVLAGAVRVRNDVGLDHDLGPGDVVGELSMLGGEPHTADVTAATACELLAIDAAAVPALLDIPAVADRLRAIGRAPLAAPDSTAPDSQVPDAQQAPTAGYGLPAPGVYSYATTGGEQISLAGARHTYPDVTHAVLRHTGGCGWSIEHHVLEEHVDIRDRCSAADAVSVVAEGREVEFFGQRDGLLYRCDPPARTLWDAPSNTVETGTCVTEDGASDAHLRGAMVGYETLHVGGAAVETAHVHIEFEMTGDSKGTSTVDIWLHPRSGLIVREERVVDTHARAVWGDVRYQEQATFHLLSLTPQT